MKTGSTSSEQQTNSSQLWYLSNRGQQLVDSRKMAFAVCPANNEIDNWCGLKVSTPNFSATNAWYIRMLDFCYVVLQPFLVFERVVFRIYSSREAHTRCIYTYKTRKIYVTSGDDSKHTRRKLISKLLWDYGYFDQPRSAKIHELLQACQPPQGRADHVLRHFLSAFQIDVPKLAAADRIKILTGVKQLTKQPVNEDLISVVCNHTYLPNLTCACTTENSTHNHS